MALLSAPYVGCFFFLKLHLTKLWWSCPASLGSQAPLQIPCTFISGPRWLKELGWHDDCRSSWSHPSDLYVSCFFDLLGEYVSTPTRSFVESCFPSITWSSVSLCEYKEKYFKISPGIEYRLWTRLMHTVPKKVRKTIFIEDLLCARDSAFFFFFLKTNNLNFRSPQFCEGHTILHFTNKETELQSSKVTYSGSQTANTRHGFPPRLWESRAVLLHFSAFPLFVICRGEKSNILKAKEGQFSAHQALLPFAAEGTKDLPGPVSSS